jgi:formylglycine-generating enzyme
MECVELDFSKGAHVNTFSVITSLLSLCLASASDAQTFMPTVRVGDVHNSADTRIASDGTVGYGRVDYEYRIGKYEVTSAQYAVFLNAVASEDTHGLYNPQQSRTDAYNGFFGTGGCGIIRSGESGSYRYTVDPAFVNRPVSLVSFWDVCRFANWMNNGQPTGRQDSSTTEDGAYTLAADRIETNSVGRNQNWQWAICSENEWYKAAFYKGGGTQSGYFAYPTASDSDPGRDLADANGNNANYYGDPYPIDGTHSLTEVGQFANSASPYGTFDQGGNVQEWNESLVGEFRGLRGGCFYDYGVRDGQLRADSRKWETPSETEYLSIGFRLVQIPSPSVLSLAGFGLAIAIRRHR